MTFSGWFTRWNEAQRQAPFVRDDLLNHPLGWSETVWSARDWSTGSVTLDHSLPVSRLPTLPALAARAPGAEAPHTCT